jgi:shikimate kinase
MKIVVFGFKSSGKTTFGSLLANHLSLPFLDLDALLLAQHQNQKSITDLFFELKEDIFREQESILLKEICKKAPIVLSLGGGSLDLLKNRDYIQDFDQKIFLDVSFETVLKRILPFKNYPYREGMKEKYEKRVYLFKLLANIHLTINTLEPQEILDLWKKNAF